MIGRKIDEISTMIAGLLQKKLMQRHTHIYVTCAGKQLKDYACKDAGREF